MGLFVLISLISIVSSAPCDITGNWTSTLQPNQSVVHIEIVQAANGTIVVHATPWGGATGTGFVNDHDVSLLMVGATQPTLGTISVSPYKDYNTGQPAPDCTWLSYGWCEFPYCPIPEPPVWPPWPTASCAINGPCPPPTGWIPTYQLNLSTVIQPCNSSGYFTDGGNWGLVSFDWENAQALWLKDPVNESTCEETLVEQAKQVKAVNPLTKVFVYRNMELALEWLSSERDAMYDPTKKDFFLQYQTGPNAGQIYNEPVSQGDQYFWNFSVPEAVDYFINVVVLGSGGMGSPYIDGVFTDDVTGLGEEHPDAAANMGLTDDQVTALHDSTNAAYMQMLSALIERRGYNWQAFSVEDGVYPSPTKSNCADAMRYLCQSSSWASPMLLELTQDFAEQNVASFLIARGDYWWLGTGWIGCSNDAPYRPALLDLDVGLPISNCTESTPNVFQRKYSNGIAQLDCNSFTPTLEF